MHSDTCHVSAPGSGYWRCDAGPASELEAAAEAGDNLTETGGGFSAASPGRLELGRQVCCHHCSLYQHLYHHNQCCHESQRILDKNTFSLAPFVPKPNTIYKILSTYPLFCMCEMLSVRRPEGDWEQSLFAVCGAGICSGTSEGGITHHRLLLRTAVRGLLANCFYIKHFILDEINSIIVGGFVKNVYLKCVSKELCNDCWASVKDQSSPGEILMDSEGLWVSETCLND